MIFTPVAPKSRSLTKNVAQIRVATPFSSNNDLIFSHLATQRMGVQPGGDVYLEFGQTDSGQVAMRVCANPSQNTIKVSRVTTDGRMVLSSAFLSDWVYERFKSMVNESKKPSSIRLVVPSNPEESPSGNIFILSLHADDMKISGSSAKRIALATA